MVLSTFPSLWGINLGQKMTVDTPDFCTTLRLHIGTATGLRLTLRIFWKLSAFLSDQTKGVEILRYDRVGAVHV